MGRQYSRSYVEQLVVAGNPVANDSDALPEIDRGDLAIIADMQGVVDVDKHLNTPVSFWSLEALRPHQYSNQLKSGALVFDLSDLARPIERVLVSEYSVDELGPIQRWVDAKSRNGSETCEAMTAQEE